MEHLLSVHPDDLTAVMLLFLRDPANRADLAAYEARWAHVIAERRLRS